ncbi:MAG: class I SAM-dependent RNA methyltransferase [Betaproteobacteria bacterium]
MADRPTILRVRARPASNDTDGTPKRSAGASKAAFPRRAAAAARAAPVRGKAPPPPVVAQPAREREAAPRTQAMAKPAPLPGPVFFAACPGGLEDALAAEFAELGIAATAQASGGVHFQGDWSDCYRANLHSRIASRILWRVGRARYRGEEDVFKAALALDWPAWFSVDLTIRVQVTAVRSPLRSLEFVTLRIKDAVCDRFRAAAGRRPYVDTSRPGMRIHAFLTADEVLFYLDTSGEALFKRGWRKHAVEAPLRENLAAGILRLAGWTPGTTLFDPMCGSGTFLVEAAQIAAGIPPGAGRGFAFQDLRAFQQELWESLRAPAPSPGSLASCGVIAGADSDPAAVAMARANCIEAGVAAQVQLLYGAFVEIDPPVPPGLLVTNPPYGVRVGDREALAAAYPAWGDRLKQRYAGWRACFLSSDMDLARHIGLKAQRRVPLYNGALACRLFEYFMVAGRPGASGAP